MHRHLVRTEHTAWTSAALFFVSLYAGAVRGRTRGVATGGCESERWCSAGVGLRTVVREERADENHPAELRAVRRECECACKLLMWRHELLNACDNLTWTPTRLR